MAPNAEGGSDRRSRVSVAVRVRPLIGQELSERCNECISACQEDRKQVRKAGCGGLGGGACRQTRESRGVSNHRCPSA